MPREVCYVFCGSLGASGSDQASDSSHSAHPGGFTPHESPGGMTGPLVVLAGFSLLLGFIGTPSGAGFQELLNGHIATPVLYKLLQNLQPCLLLLSRVLVFFRLRLF